MNRLLTTCVLFLTLSIAQCLIDIHGGKYSITRLPLSGSVNIYGRGISKDHLLLADCDESGKEVKYNCTASIFLINTGASIKCNYYSTNRTIQFNSIDQLTTNRLILKWREKWIKTANVKNVVFLDKIAIVDMYRCRTLKTIERPRDLLRSLFVYKNNFDLLMIDAPCKNGTMCYQSYDFDGNKIGGYHTLPLHDLDKAAMFSVSRESHWNGLYVYNGSSLNVINVLTNKVIKHPIVTLSYAGVVDVVDDHSFAICGVSKGDHNLECQQHYLNNDHVFISKPYGIYHRQLFQFLNVHGLKSDGMVLFGLELVAPIYLVVVEMRPNQRLYVQRHEIILPNVVDVKVMDIDEYDGSFTLVYSSWDENVPSELILYKSLLPSRFQKMKSDE